MRIGLFTDAYLPDINGVVSSVATLKHALEELGHTVFIITNHKGTKIVEDENGFLFYQSEDENSGEFTYFAFSPDSMETTYHLEFRYAEDINDLQSWFEGNYAYWNAAGIAENYNLETMQNVIELFVTENLSSAE